MIVDFNFLVFFRFPLICGNVGDSVVLETTAESGRGGPRNPLIKRSLKHFTFIGNALKKNVESLEIQDSVHFLNILDSSQCLNPHIQIDRVQISFFY